MSARYPSMLNTSQQGRSTVLPRFQAFSPIVDPIIPILRTDELPYGSTEEHSQDAGLTIYQFFLNLQLYRKLLRVYSTFSEQLVSSCEPYARRSLDFTPLQWSPGSENWAALVWYKGFSKDIRTWASLELKNQLFSWEEIKKGLLRHQRNIPECVANLSNTDQSAILRTDKFQQRDAEELKDALHTVLSSRDEIKSLLRLEGPKVQIFIDLLDDTMNYTDPTSRLHAQCLHCLRKLCGRSRSLPSSCIVDSKDLSKTSSEPLMSGGFADIWSGIYKERRVALKALRVYGMDNLEKVQTSFCREAVLWKKLSHPNILPFLGASTTVFPLCMVCEWMEHGNISKFLKLNPDVNRLKLLVDVARGLKYLHSIGVLHGDLKGANILINDSQCAILSDFGLTAVTYDPNTVNAITTTAEAIGSVRWMAPEIIHPDETECRRSSPESDIFALAMVIWEVFAGNVPYYEYARDATVVFKITIGIRPERPPDATPLGLSDMVWSVIEMCWQEWKKRPRITFVLQCLEEAHRQFVPPAPILTKTDARLKSDDDSDSDDDDPLFRPDYSVPSGAFPNGCNGIPAFATSSQVSGASSSFAGGIEDFSQDTSAEFSIDDPELFRPLSLQWEDAFSPDSVL